MVDTYELPTVSPHVDFSESVGLLLGLIEDVLDNPYVWDEEDRADARLYVANLKDFIMGMPDAMIQTGMCIDTAAAATPTGYLECDGSAISRTDYAALFAAIGTTYGTGNGTTTFNVPDFQGRSAIGRGQGASLSMRSQGQMVGTEQHTLTLTETPPHTHTSATSAILARANSTAGTDNRLMRGSGTGSNQNVNDQLTFTTTSQGGGTSHNNMSPALVIRKVIKT